MRVYDVPHCPFFLLIFYAFSPRWLCAQESVFLIVYIDAIGKGCLRASKRIAQAAWHAA
jgi:hypothetical protein